MRIISQNGTVDVPYELTSIQLVSKTTIVAQGSYFGSSSDDNFVTVAEYSTEAKAIKAMKMFRKAYTGSVAIFQNVEPTDKVVEALKRQDTEIVYASLDSQPSEIKFENHQNFYFQFPKDDEV